MIHPLFLKKKKTNTIINKFITRFTNDLSKSELYQPINITHKYTDIEDSEFDSSR